MLTPITKQTKALAKLVDPNSTLQALTSIVFEPSGAVVVADQYRMLIAKEIDFNGSASTRSLIPAQAIIDAELPKGQKLAVVSIDETVGDYPDYQSIIPDLNAENSLTFYLNARFMVDVLQAIQKLTDDKDATITITAHQILKRKPIKLQSGNFTGYIMPITT